MTCTIISTTELGGPVGRGVCAIGVFDGVHVGHAAIVRDAARLAAQRRVAAYAVTFDRDPDQVTAPSSAAPQLLTLEDKAAFLCEQGLDAVLVVPFDTTTASLTPFEFFEDVLLGAVDPLAIVVGEDFRFGHYAQGSVETLTALARPHGIDVVARTLVSAHDVPVTSTRIRGLVAAGEVEAAEKLLGRPHRVSGVVVRGRGEGASIGVPTANVDPVAFAALPAPGVYAGRARVRGGVWPAAISVGRPPTYPEATAELEAHLIGFDSDIYDAPITLEFLSRLREQRRFDSTAQLLEAMRADIESTTRIGAERPAAGEPGAVTAAGDHSWDANPLTGLLGGLLDAITGGEGDGEPDVLEDGTPVVEDPDVLEAAERAVAGIEPPDAYAGFDDTWVEVLGSASLFNTTARLRAYEITAPLQAEDIPFAWDPMPPEELSTVRPEVVSAMRFRLFVAPEHAARARELVAWWDRDDA